LRFDYAVLVRVLKYTIIAIFVLTFATQAVSAMQYEGTETSTEVSLPEYIYQCYDGTGFADRPGGESNLETTLKAIELLQKFEQSQWNPGTYKYIDNLVTQYAEMQSGYRGGFTLGDDSSAPDLKITALILEILRITNRLDLIDVPMVERYLWSSFRGSLALESLLSDGVFEDKYWALRAANVLDNIEILGLRHIDLANIISPDASLMDFPEINQIIKWQSMILSNDTSYGVRF
jgi:hypothetical protein